VECPSLDPGRNDKENPLSSNKSYFYHVTNYTNNTSTAREVNNQRKLNMTECKGYGTQKSNYHTQSLYSIYQMMLTSK